LSASVTRPGGANTMYSSSVEPGTFGTSAGATVSSTAAQCRGCLNVRTARPGAPGGANRMRRTTTPRGSISTPSINEPFRDVSHAVAGTDAGAGTGAAGAVATGAGGGMSPART